MLLNTAIANGEALGAALMVLGFFVIPMLIMLIKVGPEKFFNTDEEL